MQSYYVYFAILLLLVIVILTLLFYLKREVDYFPYEKVDSLMTKSELAFYRTLQDSLADDPELILFSKVRMADIIRVIKGSDNWRGHFNRIQAKHVDFLICDSDTVEPLLIIELDDISHDRPDRMERDRFVDTAMDAAEMPIIHLPVADYDSDALRDIIYQEIGEVLHV